jgi:hypothetical protein
MKGICKYFNIAYKEVKKEPETPVIDSNIYYRVVVSGWDSLRFLYVLHKIC